MNAVSRIPFQVPWAYVFVFAALLAMTSFHMSAAEKAAEVSVTLAGQLK